MSQLKHGKKRCGAGNFMSIPALMPGQGAKAGLGRLHPLLNRANARVF
jgi:hypothetical protein